MYQEFFVETPRSRRVVSPDAHGKFSLSEDWLAFTTGLVLLALCLLGIIPEGLIP